MGCLCQAMVGEWGMKMNGDSLCKDLIPTFMENVSQKVRKIPDLRAKFYAWTFFLPINRMGICLGIIGKKISKPGTYCYV